MDKIEDAPAKTISIPRLNLCSTILVAQLITYIKYLLNLVDVQISAFSDSQVALAWLKTHPSSWSTFVAHEVGTVQTLVAPKRWHYVRTAENPADLATRGIIPGQSNVSSLWWNGPSFLLEPGFTTNLNESFSSTNVEEDASKHDKSVAVVNVHGNESLTCYSELSVVVNVPAF